jgi:glycosyltransferase involved in cell wall biosynthesis
MRVVYDVSVLGSGHYRPISRTGIFRVVEQVALGLAASPECELAFSAMQSVQVFNQSLEYLKTTPELRGIPTTSPPLGRSVVQGLADCFKNINARPQPGVASLVARRLVAESLRLTEALLHRFNSRSPTGSDIFHSPYLPLPRPATLAKLPRRFLTVYDLIPIHFPHFFRAHVIRRMDRAFRSLAPDDWAICISQATRNDLCDRFGIDPARTFVTHLAASSDLFHPCSDSRRISAVREKYGIPDAPYFLSLNTLEPRKNMDLAIRSFVRLVQEQRARDLCFVLVGTKGLDWEEIANTVSRAGWAREQIILAGYVADEDLAALYSGALAFVYPSLYEGFGLPPLEAMQCGVPVITSNTSSLPEVVGDAGIMLDPGDADGLSHAMCELYGKPSLRETMRSKSLARAKQFSWRRCARETIAAYKTALAA